MVFLNDITNQTISENIEKYANSNTKNTCTRKYTMLMQCFYDWKSWRIAAKANNSQPKQNGSANTLLCLIPYMIECFI